MTQKKRIALKKFSSFEEQNDADVEYYRSLEPFQRLEILFKLIGHAEKKDGTVERCVRIYPLIESK